MTGQHGRQAARWATLAVMAIMVAACATIAPETHSLLKKPVDCRNAQDDMKRLSAAKPDGLKQTMTLAQSLSPAGLVVGIASEDMDNRKRVISGEHGEDIDRRIADIAKVCGIKIEPPAASAPEVPKRAATPAGPSWAKDALQSSP